MDFYTNVLQHRNKILVCGYQNGKRYKTEVNYRPYLFVPTKKQTKYKTIHGDPVDKINFDNIADARTFLKSYEDVDGMPIYGSNKFAHVYIFDNFKNIQYDTSLIKSVIIDIEVSTDGGYPDMDTANKEITAITMNYNDIIFTLGYKDYTSKDEKVKYIKCVDETDLLQKFIRIWSSDVYRPDVVSGWNIDLFDIPYCVNRITRVLGEEHAKKLSPWGVLEQRTITYMGREHTAYTPGGVSVLDYLQLYKKFTYTMQESYKLDHIASIELGENKIDYSEYGTLDDLYKQNFEKYIDYNIHDTVLVKRLDDRMKLLDLVYRFAYDSGTNFIDALTSVRSWEVIIHNYLLERNKVVPRPKKSEQDLTAEGAYVKDPIIGMHDWVVSFDLTSLYPSLIMTYNISPDTFRGTIRQRFTIEQLLNGDGSIVHDYLKQNNLSMTANGCLYTRDKQGFLADLMEQLFEQRQQYKARMIELEKQYQINPTIELENEIVVYSNLQKAVKVKLNSLYGALANKHFTWYDLKYAESITVSGQLTIRWAEKHINQYINRLVKSDGVDYVIAVDTDSLYIRMDQIVEKLGQTDKQKIHDMLTKFCKQNVQSYLSNVYQSLADYMNCYKQKLFMKLEIVSDRAIFIAKKRYVANVISSEGVQYKSPKMKMMGIEAVRSSVPLVCRKAIKDALFVIMSKSEDELRLFIEDFRNKFNQMTFEQVAFPRGVNGIDKYQDSVSIYKKGTPIHVRGALIYNKLLKDNNLEGRYTPIYDRDKIKFCYMQMPNPAHSNVISVSSDLPKQFGLDKYIDYDLQFEKTFLEPIKTILDVIGWSVEKKNNLQRFFG